MENAGPSVSKQETVPQDPELRQRQIWRARGRAISEITLAILDETSLDDVLHMATGRIVELTRADSAFILLLCPDGQSLRSLVIHGADEGPMPDVASRLQDRSFFLHARSLRHAAFLTREDITGAEKILFDHLGMARCIVTPLAMKGDPVGVAGAGWSDAGPEPDPDDLAFVADLAAHCSLAISRDLLAARPDPQQCVRQLEQMKERFLASVSHELRTPLTAIKGYTQVVIRQAVSQCSPGCDGCVSRLKVVDSQVNRMTDLIDQILDLSRIQLGKLEFRKSPMDLVKVLTRAIQVLKSTAPRHRISLSASAPRIIGTWDESRVEQIIFNLIANAIKYSPSGGPISVKARVEDAEVVVSVTDHGIGIPLESQAHLFEQFFQGNNVSHDNYGGIGLGLYISNQIAAAHGGRMWASSREGHGSTFFLSLPLDPPASAANPD